MTFAIEGRCAFSLSRHQENLGFSSKNLFVAAGFFAKISENTANKKRSLDERTISVVEGDKTYFLWICISRSNPKSLEQRRLTIQDLDDLRHKSPDNLNAQRFTFRVTLKAEICAETSGGTLFPVSEKLLPEKLRSQT